MVIISSGNVDRESRGYFNSIIPQLGEKCKWLFLDS